MHYKGFSMVTYLNIFFLVVTLLSGCTEIPSSESLDNDIHLLDKDINETQIASQKYSGGLILTLINMRLETLKSTKTMLEQKSKGLNRFIPVSYSIDGQEYLPPANKDILLQDLEKDMKHLKNKLAEAEKKSNRYSGGLLKVTHLMEAATIQNSIALLEQKELLLKYDIPYYSILRDTRKSDTLEYKKTPGEDIDKL